MKATLFILSFLIIGLSANAQESDEYIETVKGKIIQKKAYNKAGKEMKGAGDYFLHIKGEEILFIKIMSSGITADELAGLLDKKAKFKIIRKNGLWDTDNPEVQSRIGPYVTIQSIVE